MPRSLSDDFDATRSGGLEPSTLIAPARASAIAYARQARLPIHVLSIDAESIAPRSAGHVVSSNHSALQATRRESP